jgi:hypothetical protein
VLPIAESAPDNCQVQWLHAAPISAIPEHGSEGVAADCQVTHGLVWPSKRGTLGNHPDTGKR